MGIYCPQVCACCAVPVHAFRARLESVSGPARPPYPGHALLAMAAPEPQPEGCRSLSALLSGIAQAAFHGNAGITEELLRAQLYPETPPEEFRALRTKMGGLLQVPGGKGPRSEGRDRGLREAAPAASLPPGVRAALPSPARGDASECPTPPSLSRHSRGNGLRPCREI